MFSLVLLRTFWGFGIGPPGNEATLSISFLPMVAVFFWISAFKSISSTFFNSLPSTPGSVASTPPNFIAPFSGDSITVSPSAPIEILPLLISPIFPALFVFNTIFR